jgi:hypothetical protein
MHFITHITEVMMKAIRSIIILFAALFLASGIAFSQDATREIVDNKTKKVEKKEVKKKPPKDMSKEDEAMARKLLQEDGAGQDGDESESTEVDEKKFLVSGFIDMQAGYTQFFSKYAYMKRFISDKFHFSLQNLNLYFVFFPYKGFTVFSEIRFMFSPTGKQEYSPVYNVYTPFDNSITDSQGYSFRYGSIYIERAYIEWNTYEFFKVRAGRMLTPYGIWSQEHGAPVVTSIRVPALVNPLGGLTAGVPPAVTGFEVFGTLAHHKSGFMFDYAMYVGNNWTESEPINDFTADRKAFGGYINFRMPTIANRLDFEVGLSAYSGQRKNEAYRYYMMYSSAALKFNTVNQMDTIWSMHFKISLGNLPAKGTFIVQGESMKQYVRQKNTGAIIVANKEPMKITPGYSNDYFQYFSYIQAEYQFLGWITPYFRYEYLYNQNANQWLVYRSGDIFIAGMNIKPVPILVLKFEFTKTLLHPIFKVGNNDFNIYQMSVSMSF